MTTESLDFVTNSIVGALTSINNNPFSKESEFTVKQIKNYFCIDYSKAISIACILESRGLCTLKTLVYHTCQDHYTDLMDFRKGLVSVPNYHCPVCGNKVESYAELEFEISVSLI